MQSELERYWSITDKLVRAFISSSLGLATALRLRLPELYFLSSPFMAVHTLVLPRQRIDSIRKEDFFEIINALVLHSPLTIYEYANST